MADTAGSGARASAGNLSLDDLIALNEEMTALVRAGVPLERGLKGLAGDLPNRLGKISAALADQMGRGQSLAAALDSEPTVFPPLYRALVTAGQRSGRLAGVLEALTVSAEKLRDARQTMLLALAYPLGVVLLAFGLWIGVQSMLYAGLVPIYEHHTPTQITVLAALGRMLKPLWLALPLAAIALFGWWWYRSGRSLVVQGGSAGRWLGWLPGVGRLVSDAQSAALMETLALLLEQGVPLPEAVRLAAGVVSDRRDAQAIGALADRLEQGNGPEADLPRGSSLTPLVRWLIVAGQSERTLVPLVRHSAEMYRQRMLRRADWLRFSLPAILTIGVAGTVVLAYAFSLYEPYAALLWHLSS